MKLYLALIVLLPFAGFLINGLGRKVLGKSAIAFTACAMLLGSFILSVLAFMDVKANGGQTVHYFNFIAVDKLTIPFAFKVDQLSSIFLLIITGDGFLIHLYSTSYMHEEKSEHYGRYFAYLN